MDTTTTTDMDPYDLIVDGILSAHADEGAPVFSRSVHELLAMANKDPEVLVYFFGVIIDMLEINMETAGMDLDQIVDFVREAQRADKSNQALLAEVQKIFEELDE